MIGYPRRAEGEQLAVQFGKGRMLEVTAADVVVIGDQALAAESVTVQSGATAHRTRAQGQTCEGRPAPSGDLDELMGHHLPARNIVRAASGYKTLEARDGAEAGEDCASSEGTIDLLRTDVVMPRMGGSELARRLLALRPGIRVLYMSACEERALAGRSDAESIAEFIEKPFTAAALTRNARRELDAPR